MGSAYAEFQEQAKGSIPQLENSPTWCVKRDIFVHRRVKIRDVKVWNTFVGGKMVLTRTGSHN